MMTTLTFKRTGRGDKPLAVSSIKTYTALLTDMDFVINKREKPNKNITYETLLEGKGPDWAKDIWKTLQDSEGRKTKKKLTEKRMTMMMSAMCSAMAGYKDICADECKEDTQRAIDDINDIIQPIYKKQTDEKKNKKLKKSDAIEKNWATWEELIKRREELQFSVKALMIKHKPTLTMIEYKLLQSYLISCLYTMIYPRRNLWRTCKFIDYMKFKQLKKKGELPKEQNYIIKQKGWKQLYFYIPNQKSNGHTEYIKIPKPLKKVIKLSRQHNKSDYLITMIRRNNLDKPVASDLMSKMINDTFRLPDKNGKRRVIGSKMIRAIHDSRPEIRQILVKAHEIADEMGHSVETAINNYSYEK
tara:strand:+ start:679 stop:1755 length:1077 start_codon:yes stop_codon:yes gene_type:complete